MIEFPAPLVFTVHGTPATKGSMKPVPIGKGTKKRIALIESHATSKPWREAVKSAALDAILAREGTGRPFATLSGPVEVEVVYGFPKPKSAPKTRRTWPITRSSGDLDKLHRNVLDALTDVAVLGDDSQVAKLTGVKVYAGEGDDGHLVPHPGAWVMVRPLPEAVAAGGAW